MDPNLVKTELRHAFKQCDTDGTGDLQLDEMHAALKKIGHPLSDKEIRDLMKEADVNGDGKIEADGKYDVTEIIC